MNTLFAYIDPFTGSLVLQLLAMGFLSMVIFFKKAKDFVLSLFGIKKAPAAEMEPQEVQSIKLEEAGQKDKKAA